VENLPHRRTRGARPRRGRPAETRDRLVAAAAKVLNKAGYHGTDSNRLARAAGYAPATFYKHFADKRAILLAAYDAWVTAEWAEIGRLLETARSPDALGRRIVAMVLAHHRRWRGLRASLRALVATDPVARRFYRAQRRRQLALIAGLRRAGGVRARPAESDALLLFTLERVCDAIADGEAADLGLSTARLVARLRRLVAASLG
jgi:AcrR family transcriptional regulator